MRIKTYFLLLVCVMIAACAQGPQEPGEEEMRAAASREYDEINERMRTLAADCREQGSMIVNPVKAFKCASVCAMDSKNCETLPTLEMVNFEKLACTEAVGQPGWVCDYRYEVTSESDFVVNMFEKVYGKQNLAQARFFESDEEWIMIKSE